MAHDKLDVSATDLRSGAQRLQRVSDDFAEAWSSFVSEVESLGDVFGSDEIGVLTGESYASAHHIAHDAFASASGALVDFAEGLSAMAESHEGTEEEVRSLFTSLDGSVGRGA